MADTTAAETGGSDDKSGTRFEAIIATLLGLAAILVAVASYQGSLRDGDSIKAFNEGIRAVNDSNGWFTEATQKASRDQGLFLEYAKAAQAEDGDLATYLKEAIMDENLRGAVKEWEDDDTNEIATPLDAPKYETPEAAEGERLAKLTDRKFAEARALDEEGDQYNLVGVIVASSLFFLGIAGVVRSKKTRLFGTVLGAATLVGSFGIWLTI